LRSLAPSDISGCAALILLAFALPSEAVTLRYSLKKGAEITYRVQVAGASLFRSPGEEKTEMKTQLEQTLRFRVTEVSPEGEMELEQQVLSGRLKIRAEGEEHQTPLPKGKARFKLSPLGKVSLLPPAEETPAEPAEEEGAAADLEPFSPLAGVFGFGSSAPEMDFLVACTFLPLPEKEVKPGDVWEEELEVKSPALSFFPGEQPERARLKVKSELLELTLLKGRKCARIRTRYELPLSSESPLEEAFKLTVSGKMVGEAEWHFDYENCCTPAASGSLQTALKMSLQLPPDFEAETSPELNGEFNQETALAMKANLKTTLLGR